MEICMCVYAFDAFQWLSCAKSEKISTSTCQQRLLIRTSGVNADSLEKKNVLSDILKATHAHQYIIAE